jgi:hypothetical protein
VVASGFTLATLRGRIRFKTSDKIKLVLPLVLCKCDIWSFNLNRELGLIMCENIVLRFHVDLTMQKKEGCREKLYNKDLHHLYPSSKPAKENKSRRIRWQ